MKKKKSLQASPPFRTAGFSLVFRPIPPRRSIPKEDTRNQDGKAASVDVRRGNHRTRRMLCPVESRHGVRDGDVCRRWRFSRCRSPCCTLRSPPTMRWPPRRFSETGERTRAACRLCSWTSAKRGTDHLDVPEAILKAKRMGAHGIRIYLNLSIEGPVNWDLLLNKKPAVVEEMYESLRRHDVRLMLQVEDHDGRTAKFVSYLFRLWPDMSRRVVVASSSPLFLLTLGGNNKAIVKALVWCPCSVAYTDAMCTRPRNDNLGWHLVASAADWFYRWCFGWGLLTRASMASAVVVRHESR
ncbi:hypothetical protein MRX96_033011 [Rhipicephalus microplus]